MKLPLQLNRLPRAHSCSFGLLVFAFSFSWSSDSASHAPSPRLEAESSATSTQSQPGLSLGTALKEEKETNAEASLAVADRLRDEQRKESNEKAIEEYKKAADLWRATGNFQQAAVALRNAGEIYQILGHTQDALSHYEESLAVSRKGKSLLESARVLNDLGYLHFILGNTAVAQQNCFAALRLGKMFRNQAVVAQANSIIGETFYSFGDLARAQDYQLKALNVWDELGDRRGQAQSSIALGYYYTNLSEPVKALDSYSRALTLSRSVHYLRGETLALIAIGNLKSKLGEKQEALEAYSNARQLAEQTGDQTCLAIVFGGTGYIYYGLGDKEKALDYLNQAVKLFEVIDGKWGVAEVKMDLGRIHHSQGDTQKALDYFHEALVEFRTLSMPRLEAQTLRDIGLVQSVIGDKDGALASYKEALRLTRIGQDQRQETYTLNYIGQVYESIKQTDRAIAYYRRALPLSKVAADPGGESLTLYNLSHIARDSGHLAEAKSLIEAAIKIAESLRTKVVNKDLRASYFATVRQDYELYIDILMRLHKERPNEDFVAQAFAVSEKARARSFLELLQEAKADIRQGVDPKLLERERSLEETLNAKADRQMKLLAAKEKGEAEKIAKEIDKLTREYADVCDQIRATSQHYAALTLPRPLSLREVQQQVLDDDSLLVEYMLSDDRSYVWAVTRTDVSSYALAGRAEIEALARSLYESFTSYQPLPGEPLEQRQQRQSKADSLIPQQTASLSKLVLAPLAGKLGNKRLLIVADGALQYIPFQALTMTETKAGAEETQLLLRNHEIINEQSASTLGVLLKEIASRKRAADTVAVLADPVFEADDPRIGRARDQVTSEPTASLEVRQALRDIGIASDGVQIPRLFASGLEAEAIMAAAPWGTGSKSVGFDASRSKVMGSDLASFRIVHLATHGMINNEHPELSGIVLSLFDQEGHSQDGFLRLHDIFNLHLPVDLVVLSACSSGLGKDVKGEGLIGLTRGFMYAGAAGVVASLWKVDDDATAELMRHFYEAMFTKGLSPSAALRESQLSMAQSKRWHAPYYWAGFVIQGEYNELENMGRRSPTTHKQAAVLIALASTLLLTFFVFRRRRRRII